jgi:hypothetical protein
VGLSILEEIKSELLQMSMEEALVFLKEFTKERKCNTYSILERACSYKVTP